MGKPPTSGKKSHFSGENGDIFAEQNLPKPKILTDTYSKEGQIVLDQKKAIEEQLLSTIRIQTQVLSLEKEAEILERLKRRFENHFERHAQINWNELEKKLVNHPHKLWSLFQMEMAGGEPDVLLKKNDVYYFYDCSPETPAGRTNIVYDGQAEEEFRSKFPDRYIAGNAMQMAKNIGVELFDQQDLDLLQSIGTFDRHSQNWLLTPASLRFPNDPTRTPVALYYYCDDEGYYIMEDAPESIYSNQGARFKLAV